jgi:hypothetical protein
MNSLKMSPFYRKLSTVETMVSQVSDQYPDLQPALDDLLYPIVFLTRLAKEAEGVLANDPNCIERMRYLLVPAATEESYIRDAVSELLPSKEAMTARDFQKLKDNIDLNDTFIHYGELVVLALATGRVGMQPFNLTESTNDFIDVVKFYALATLPVQALLRVLYAGMDIDNFIVSIGRQAKRNGNYVLLKSLARTFWDSRELASAIAIDELINEVKRFFEHKDLITDWDGLTPDSINIKGIQTKVNEVKFRLHIDSDYDPDKHGESLQAYFVWESANDGDNLGYITRMESLSTLDKDYKLTNHRLKIKDYDHPSGWLALQTALDIESTRNFCENMKEHWASINSTYPVLKQACWPIPLDKIPDLTLDSQILPVIRREQNNKWGPEIIEKSLILPDKKSVAGDSVPTAAVEIKYHALTTPTFRLERLSGEGSGEIAMETKSIDDEFARFEFSLEQLTEKDRTLALSMYAGKRKTAYDVELIDMSGWFNAAIGGAAEEDIVDENGADGDTDAGGVVVIPGDTANLSALSVVMVRPGLLQTISATNTSVNHAAKVFQVDYDNAANALQALAQHSNLQLKEISLPFQSDEEVSYLTDEVNLSEESKERLLDRLSDMAEHSLGLPGALWISLIKSAKSFFKVGLSSNAHGLIVATPDRLNQAYDQLSMIVGPRVETRPEESVNFDIHVINGAVSVDRFIIREPRILKSVNQAAVPSQWVALGYAKNRQLLFERRINFPCETFSGEIYLTLPDYPDLEKIELRYLPQLFAIEVTSITQPKIAEASVRLLSNASVLKGSAFRPVMPSPKTRLISIQKIPGAVNIAAQYDRSTHFLSWSKGHSAGLDTRLKISIRNRFLSRVFVEPSRNTNKLKLDQLVVKDSEVESLESLDLSISDGWNIKHLSLSKKDNPFAIDGRKLLPRHAGKGIYWIDSDRSAGDTIDVEWYVNDKKQFSHPVPIDVAVHLPDVEETAEIRIEMHLLG